MSTVMAEEGEETNRAATNRTARGRKQHRQHLAGRQDYEGRHEARTTGRSKSAVTNEVKKVGNSRERVERRLER